MGDSVKIKYSVSLTTEAHPFGGTGKKVCSVGWGDVDPVRFTIGQGGKEGVIPAVENGVIGTVSLFLRKLRMGSFSRALFVLMRP